MAMIGICLATFNGARFLAQQLDSIAAQSFADWHLYVRDDHSTDATPALLADFAARHPGRVSVLTDEAGRLGARGNFERLMADVREPYVAFSDQDDVWHGDKLARAHAALRRLEADHAPGTPVMVHGDRRIIGAGGTVIADSYWRSRGIGPGDFQRLETHYTFCLAAGATMLINRPLCALALPIPPEARMYDTWIELLAHAFGAVGALEEVVLDHRRHGSNTSGAVGDNNSAATRRPLARARRLLGNLDRQRAIYRGFVAQARAFRAMHGPDLSRAGAMRLDRFIAVSHHGLVRRAVALWAARAAPPGVARTLAFLALSGASRPTR